MKILVLALAVLASSCGQKTPSNPSSSKPVSEQIVIEQKEIVLTLNDETEAEVLSFGTFQSGAASKGARLTISNATGGNLTLGNLKSLIEAWDNSTNLPNSVTVINDTCSNKILRKPPTNPSACYVDINITYNEGLDNNILTIPLRGTDPLTAPTVQLVVDISETYLQSEALITAGESLIKSTEVLNFGVLALNTSSTKRLYISNLSTVASIPAPPVPALPTGLTIIRNTCSTIPKLASCFMDFKYTHQPTNLDTVINFVSTQLNEGQKTLQVSSTNLQNNITGNEPKLSLSYQNFPDTNSVGGRYIRRITATNLSTLVSYTFGANEIAQSVVAPFSVLRNNCDGYTIIKEKSCYVDLLFEPTVENQQAQLSINLPNANLSQVIAAGPPLVACTLANAGIANASSVSGNQPSCTLVSCATNYDKVGNSCVAQACVLADFSNAATLSGDKAVGCSIATCNPNYTVDNNSCVPAACTTSDIANSSQVSGDKVNGCTLVACAATYSNVGGACVSSNVTRACQIQPGNSSGGLETSTDGGVTYGACQNFICNTNYSVSGNACIPTLCSPADVANAATVSGDKVNGCTALTCNATFSEVGGACVSSNVTRACQVQPLNSTGGLESSSDGGQTYGACENFTCNNNYEVSANSCVAQSCNISDYPGAATVSGDKVAGCIVDSCSSALQEVQSNSCVDIAPSGSIAFSQQYTKEQTNNQLNVTSVNAQQIQFYSDSGCSVVEGAAQAIAATYQLNLSSGDGEKNAYAKLVNGAASSACYSSSIILDTTAPDIAITTPVMAGTVTGDSLIVSGTCVDAGSGVSSISLEVSGGITGSAVCSAGIFNTTIDISVLSAEVSYFISAIAEDNAGNETVVNSSFTKEASEYQIAFSISGGGIVTWTKDSTVFSQSGASTATLAPGESVTLTADTQNGFKYLGWGPGTHCDGLGLSTTCEVSNVQDNVMISVNVGEKECSDSMRQSELDAIGISTANTTLDQIPTEVNKLAGVFYPACTLQQGLCLSGNELSSNLKNCYASCTTMDISGSAEVDGNVVEGCSLISCQNGYNEVGEACVEADLSEIIAEYDSTPVSIIDALTIGPNDSKLIAVIFKNIGQGTSAQYSASLSNSDFLITTNSCENKELQSGESCQVTVQFSSFVKVPGEYSVNLEFGGQIVGINIEILDNGIATNSQNLEYVGLSAFAGSAATGVFSSPSGVGVGVSVGGSSSVGITGTLNLTEVAAATGTGVASLNSTITRVTNINLEVFPSSTSLAGCTFSIPLSPTPACSTSMAINSSNISALGTSGNLVVSTPSFPSIQIPYSVYEIAQVSNISASATVTDGINMGVVYNDHLYFGANNSGGFTKLHKINNLGQISRVADIGGSTRSDGYDNFFVYNGFLYFTSRNSNNQFKLYKTNQSGQITKVSNFKVDTQSDLFQYPVEFNGEIYFRAATTATLPAKLYKMNSQEQVVQVSNINAGASDNPIPHIVYNNELYFVGLNSNAQSKLFKINTAGEISQITDINGPTVADFPSSNRVSMEVYNNHLYFPVSSSQFQKNRLYKLNSSGNVSKASSNTTNDNANNLIVFNDELYFSSNTPTLLNRWHKINKDGVVRLVSNISGSSASDSPVSPIVYDGELYFGAANSSGFWKLYKINKRGQIYQMSNIRNNADEYPFQFKIFNGQLYFAAYKNASVFKMYKLMKK